MELDTEVQGNVGIITCNGKMLIGEGDEMLRQAVRVLADNKTVGIVLDLTDVPYVDACGLAEIVRSYTTVSRAGGTLVLLGLNNRLHSLLGITKLLAVFKTFERGEQEQAVAWLLEYGRR